MDGQTYQLKNLQNQAHTAQSSYVMQPVSAQAPMATIETDMSVATGQPQKKIVPHIIWSMRV